MTNKSQIIVAVIAVVAIVCASVLIFYKSSNRSEVTQNVDASSSSLQFYFSSSLSLSQ